MDATRNQMDATRNQMDATRNQMDIYPLKYSNWYSDEGSDGWVRMKDRMDGFDVAAIVAELQSLVGARTQKIYQPSRNELLIRVNIPSMGKRAIDIDVGKWIHLTLPKPTPVKGQPTAFAMLLRKHLSNGIIKEVKQHEFDKIVEISVQHGAPYTLVIELFSDGNVILVGADGTIIQPLITQSWRDREVRAHRPYLYPPQRCNPFALTDQQLATLIAESKKDLRGALAIDANLGIRYAEEVLALAKGNREEIYPSLRLLLKKFEDRMLDPAVVIEKGEVVDVTPILLQTLPGEPVTSFNDAVERLVSYRKEGELLEEQQTTYKDRVGRYQRQLAQQREAIERFKREAEMNQKRGDAIYSHLPLCTEALKSVESGEKRYTMRGRQVLLSLEGVEVSLERGKKPQLAAERYYERSKRARRKLAGAREALVKTQRLISEGEKEEKTPRVARRERRKEWYERYHWFISSDGNLVIGGKAVESNERLVKKHLAPGDRYVHADVHGASSVVVKQNVPITQRTLEEAAAFAIAHSKAWGRWGACNAYWVPSDQVSKASPPGEHLPKGSFMIWGTRHWFHGIPPKIAIGLIDSRVCGGPLSAIKAQAEKWVLIEPGGIKKEELAKRIDTLLGAGDPEAVLRALPGDGHIAEGGK